MADPGKSPISPAIRVGPVLVMAEPPRRANVEHVPRVGGIVVESITVLMSHYNEHNSEIAFQTT